ncbi:hypothetical protein Lal_00022225 [Lupinus albus]|uniref:Uncharacterized protein n=1 Tax=Lupinus albus TaxID=3870 RepID=A0A6A4QED4_LUPAL|nr:hypothetical protein Lalb_Chr06g0170111 [Lupinus albus]KAF1880096.1 hypothetical protein Lal_00022225 [Lupinus albus]
MGAESWFQSIWKTQRKDDSNSEKVVIGVLAFEVASLMSKLVNLWQTLSDNHIARLREIMNSVGIKKLVSDDENFVVRLISLEMLENLAHLAASVARLGKKCSDPSLKNFENAFDEFITLGLDPYRWQFSSKKMDTAVKKMEKFISTNASLYQEMEVLADLEQTLGRMKDYGEPDVPNLVDYQKNIPWKRMEVKNLKNGSLWNRTYDYTVHLLARSLFTIFSRVNNVFGIREIIDASKIENSNVSKTDYIRGSQSVSELLKSSVHPPENNVARFSSGPLGAFTHKLGPNAITKITSIFCPGLLGSSSAKSGSTSGKSRGASFFSASLGRNSKKPVPDSGTNENSKIWKFLSISTTISRKEVNTRHNRLAPGKLIHSSKPFSSLYRLKPPSESLGAASLALHYASVIIAIEKLAASPYLIGLGAREGLYNMLPERMRASVRAKLKPYGKAMTSAVYAATLADEWTEAMTNILEWLAPLAHNMIRWQYERSLEQHSFVSRTNVLLVQTLYFANQEKTESIITELLVGLNYVWRYAMELKAKALVQCGGSRVDGEYIQLNG